MYVFFRASVSCKRCRSAAHNVDIRELQDNSEVVLRDPRRGLLVALAHQESDRRGRRCSLTLNKCLPTEPPIGRRVGGSVVMVEEEVMAERTIESRRKHYSGVREVVNTAGNTTTTTVIIMPRGHDSFLLPCFPLPPLPPPSLLPSATIGLLHNITRRRRRCFLKNMTAWAPVKLPIGRHTAFVRHFSPSAR